MVNDMTGRQEIDNKYRDKTKHLLIDAPKELEEFYDFKRIGLTVRTVNTYIKILSKFLKETDKDIKDIKRTDINAYFGQMLDRGCSASHRGTVYSALNSFFDFLVGEKYIDTNPMNENVERARVEKRTEIRNDYLTKEEIIAFMKQIDREKDIFKRTRNKTIIMLFLRTGMRLSALRELNIDDIDYETATIKITTKGKKTQLFENLTTVMEVLEEYLTLREKIVDKDTNALFVTEKGSRMHENVIRYMVSKYATPVTNKNITPHKLRASYCTMLYNNGVDLYTLQHLMGHESMAVTEIYIRGQKNKSGEAAAIIDKALAV